MAYDGIMMHQTIKALDIQLKTGRINKIYQISKYELLFVVRAHRKNIKFLLSCHPMYARMQLTDLQYPNPEQPNTLTMLFRKHLEGGYIKEIEQVELDRICKITLACYNELGDLVEYYLYIEVMGKHSNIILCNQDLKIIDCLKRISPSMNTTRFLQPGATYHLPPMDEHKKNPFKEQYIAAPSLTKVYQGMAPILSREIIYRVDLGHSFDTIMQEIETSQTIYVTTVEEKEFFHVIELTHLHGNCKTYPLFEGLDKHYDVIDQKDRIKQQTSNLLRYLQQEYQKNTLKLEKLEQTLHSSKNASMYRIAGDLLFSNLHLLKKGMASIDVDNYYDGTIETITLDVKLDGKQNAKRYYHKYQKAKNSINILQVQIELTKKEIEYFDGLLALLQNASYYDALEIKEELEQLGYLKKRKKYQKTNKKIKPRYTTYTTKDNIEILVGKNNLQNEYVTFKQASRFDTWFHAKDMPGSHVIVKCDVLDEYTIRLASKMAAYFSKGKESSSVPVNYTLIKNIKKLSGGKPGQVILDQYKTIYIDPDNDFFEEIELKK